MSNFICQQCGAIISDSPDGYITGCDHHPIDVIKHKKKVGKKPFTIEYKSNHRLKVSRWMTWNRYETEEQRDQAFDILVKQDKYRVFGVSIFEFRKA